MSFYIYYIVILLTPNASKGTTYLLNVCEHCQVDKKVGGGYKKKYSYISYTDILLESFRNAWQIECYIVHQTLV